MTDKTAKEIAHVQGQVLAVMSVCCALVIRILPEADRNQIYASAGEMIAGQLLDSELRDETLAAAQEFLPIMLQIPPDKRL